MATLRKVAVTVPPVATVVGVAVREAAEEPWVTVNALLTARHVQLSLVKRRKFVGACHKIGGHGVAARTGSHSGAGGKRTGAIVKPGHCRRYRPPLGRKRQSSPQACGEETLLKVAVTVPPAVALVGETARVAVPGVAALTVKLLLTASRVQVPFEKRWSW